ncbi:MAG: hypothetical protein RLO50_06125 [Azospirillaceae bacterium]
MHGIALGALPLPARRRADRAESPAMPLHFDFTGGALPAGAGFARSSPALGPGLVAVAADTPRLYPGAGLLLEGAATNLLPHSRDIAAGAWFGLNVACTGGMAGAPDGSADGFRLDFAGGGAARWLHPLTAPGGEITLSAWMWSPDGLPGRLAMVVDGAIMAPSPTMLGPQPVRLTLTLDPPAGAALQLGFLAGQAGSFGVFAWLPQLEAGVRATSAVASDGVPATRAADSLVLAVPPGAYAVTVLRGDGGSSVVDPLAGITGADGAIAVPADPLHPFVAAVTATPWPDAPARKRRAADRSIRRPKESHDY